MHVSPRAAESAEAIGAAVYTVGQDIVFGVGRFNPQIHEGRRLIAHELTHPFNRAAAGTRRHSIVTRHTRDMPMTSQKRLLTVGIVAAVPGATAVGIARDTPWGKPIASEFDDELMLMLADMRWRDPETFVAF
jgi:hypothetical protein